MRRRADSGSVRPTSRRHFLQALGAATALPLVARMAPAQTPPASTPTPATAPTPATTPAVDPGVEADARRLLDIVQRRYGSRLDGAQLDAIRDDLQDGIQSGQALRKVALGNSDEPAIVFRALPVEGPR